MVNLVFLNLVLLYISFHGIGSDNDGRLLFCFLLSYPLGLMSIQDGMNQPHTTDIIHHTGAKAFLVYYYLFFLSFV